MPRKDTCHDIVKRKLEEEEWTITHDPYIGLDHKFGHCPILQLPVALSP
jgi:hypothetical protein